MLYIPLKIEINLSNLIKTANGMGVMGQRSMYGKGTKAFKVGKTIRLAY